MGREGQVGQKEWSRSGKFWVIGSIVIAAIAIEIAGVIYGSPVIRTTPAGKASNE